MNPKLSALVIVVFDREIQYIAISVKSSVFRILDYTGIANQIQIVAMKLKKI